MRTQMIVAGSKAAADTRLAQLMQPPPTGEGLNANVIREGQYDLAVYDPDPTFASTGQREAPAGGVYVIVFEA